MSQSLFLNLCRYGIISTLSITTLSAVAGQDKNAEEVLDTKTPPFHQLIEQLNKSDYEDDTFSQTFDSQRLLEININDKAQFHFGKKDIGHSNFIYSNQYNNGISGSLVMPELNSRFRTYSVHTDQIESETLENLIENQQSIGIEDSDNRANGIIWDYQPVIAGEEKVTLTASYLSGKKVDRNSLEKTHGDASSFATEFTGLNKALRLQSEYAQSKYSTKNSKQALTYAENTHRAQHYVISYTPHLSNNSSDQKKEQAIWSIGIEKKIIDPEFKTVFNNNLPKDKDITRIYGNYRLGQWTSEASVAYEKNNLDGRLSTTDNIQLGSIAGSYESKQAYSNTGFLSAFGIPRYTLRYNHLHNTQEKHTHDNSNHNRNQSFTIESRFQHQSWSWFHNVGLSTVSDELDNNIDFDSNQVNLGTQFFIRNHTSIETSVRSYHSRKAISQLTTRELNYKLKLNQTAVANELSGYVAIEFNQRDNEISQSSSEKHQTFILSSDLNKRLLKARGIYPSIDLNLSASYRQEQNQYTDIDKKDYQALVNINISWPQQITSISD